MVTVADFFCGAGGSTTGMRAAGLDVRLAVNHAKIAIETHSYNHPDTDHACEDLQEKDSHPGRYPKTDILWASPECTQHSQARGVKRKNLNQVDMLTGKNGIDPEAEKSRVTMDWVERAARYHRYEYILCENVLEVRDWHAYQSWWHSILDLGYDGQALSLNSQFFGVPQSRDRWYAVFWRKGSKRPNLDFHPEAYCAKCDRVVQAVQAWKKSEKAKDFKPWGRYGKSGQYWYRCPSCTSIVHPPTLPAAKVINWADQGEVIQEMKKPLVKNTLNRIRAGLRKFGPNASDFIVPMRGTAVPFPSSDPLTVVTTTQQHYIVVPQRKASATAIHEPLSTITTSQQHALIVSYYSRDNAFSSISEPLPVVPTENRHSLITLPPFLSVYNNGNGQPITVDQPMWTIPTKDRHALIVPPQESAGETFERMIDEILMSSRYRLLEPEELKLAMSFPDTYTILGAKYQQIEQIGNAVCPHVAQWLAERVLEAMAA